MAHRRFTAIAVDEKNYARLQQLGKVPDSFNAILTRLLNEHDNNYNNNSKRKAKEKAEEAAITAK